MNSSPPPPSSSSSSSISTSNHFNTICYFIERNDYKNTIRLLESYSSTLNILSQQTLTSSTLLHIATKIGSTQILTLLLSYQVINPNHLEGKIYGGYGVIHYAVSMNYSSCLLVLIESCKNELNLNLKTNSDCSETALHICCKRGYLECAKILIEAGANPDSSDGFGHNPSFWAYSLRHFDMISNLSLPPPRTATPLEHMISLGANFKSFNNVIKKKKSKGKSVKKKK